MTFNTSYGDIDSSLHLMHRHCSHLPPFVIKLQKRSPIPRVSRQAALPIFNGGQPRYIGRIFNTHDLKTLD